MATNNQVNVNPVNVMVKTLTEADLKQDEDENKKRAAKRAGSPEVAVDTVTLPAKGAGVATAATPKAPNSLSAHRKLVNARENLQNALNKAGANISTDDPDLATKAQTFLDGLDQQIATLLEKGGKEEKLNALVNNRDEILSTLGDYEAIKTETAEGTVSVQSAEETGETGTSTSGPTPEEARAVFTSVDKDLKVIGLSVDPNETSYELIQNQTAAQFSKRIDELKAKESELNAQKSDLQEKLKTATAEEKPVLEAQLKQVDVDLKQILQQKKDLQGAFIRVNDVLSQAMAAQDLGITVKKDKVETRSSVTTSSASPTSSKKKSATVTTSSAVTGSQGGSKTTGGTQSTASAFTLNTASAGGTGGDAALTSGEVDTSAVAGGGLVGTASAEDPLSEAGGSLSTNSAFNDFTGTTLAIASSSNALKSDARRTEEAIKKLLRAAMSGNYEAIKTALVLLDKRASQIVIGMGTATIKAMQNYEEQQGALSKSMDSLKSDDPSYSAKLAQINSQMNSYSMNRQAIANFLQQTMTTREEIGNTTHGFISKDGQIGSALSRW
ncbi:MAG TPA: hypothetical protein VFX30_09445 [bacterium]|nr:hypothetical protein [bacterium]